MWSGYVKLDDLNDLLEIAQDCVKPIFNHPPKSDLIKLRKKQERAEVNLYDCLACSGCVTTAETVLIKEQSLTPFIENIAKKVCIVSISIQSLEFLGNYFCISPSSAFRRISNFLKNTLNVFMVLDLSATDAFLLVETFRVLLARMEENKPLITSHCPGSICHSENHENKENMEHYLKYKTSQQIMGRIIKTLTLNCINYELLRNKHIHSYLWSNYIKWIHRNFPKKKYLHIKDIYHVTVASCYDKKIETYRKKNMIDNVREVDLVLTTNELIELLDMYDISNLTIVDELNPFFMDTIILNLYQYPVWVHQALPSLHTNIERFLHKLMVNNCSDKLNLSISHKEDNTGICLCCYTVRFSYFNYTSNSFLEYCYRQMKRIINEEIPKEKPLLYTSSYNNVKKVELSYNNKKYTFILAHGYQHVQNMFKYDFFNNNCFVELMACPRGCLYGNAQFDAKNKSSLMKVSSNNNIVYIEPQFHPLIKIIYQYIFKSNPNAPSELLADFKWKSEENSNVSESLKW